MDQNQRKNKLDGLGLIPIAIVTVLLFGMYGKFWRNVSGEGSALKQVETDIKEHRAVVLDKDCDPELLSAIIFNNGYCESESDAPFIARTLIERQKKGRLKSLFTLQKRDFGQVSAHIADSCHVLNTILSVSRDKIGLANDSVFGFNGIEHQGTGCITVLVKDENKEARENVPVRLQWHYRDSLNQPQVEVLGYLRTDREGKAVFNGLDERCSYSVLPIKEGFEYGRSQGVVADEWKTNEFSFVEKEHRIPMFTNTTLRQIKSERSIVVRTPNEFKKEFDKSKWVLLLSWWVLGLVILLHPKRRLDFRSGLIVACCMFLTGLSVLMMFSMVDPLNDEIRGMEMTWGLVAGVVVASLLQIPDIVKRFHLEKAPFKNFKWLPRGTGWLFLALGLTLLLWTPLGRSVGGMRVNLSLGFFQFQPSEIAKYHILMFVSIFFVMNINRIINYSNPFESDFKKKLLTMLVVIVGLVALMALYLVLGDMGPGLVLGITFVLLYSFCKSKQDMRIEEKSRWKEALKCDVMMLLYGVATYALVLLLFYRSGVSYWYVWGSLLWLVGWIFIGLWSFRKIGTQTRLVFKKQVHETAIIMNLVIFIFILGSNAGKDTGVLKRLEERTNMCTNTWGGMDKVFDEVRNDTLTQIVMNDPVSNTQVANSLWALASGGFEGQGWGKGKPSVVPAFHTDMILSSIGEQRGWIGLLFVIVAYWILLHTVARKGIKTGEPLAIYVCVGVAIVTAVQLFVIALGSAGVIPLTGVTVPFLSYGRTSMIFNILAFGLVLSLVTRREEQTNNEAIQLSRKNIAEAYRRPSLIAGAVFVGVSLFTLSVWAKYQWRMFQREKTILQPAFAINIQGDPVLEYNPRIGLIAKEMYAGRIFDRNGLLLATSNKDDIDVAGLSQYLDREQLEQLRRRHLKRYYPFAEQLFFMVGDQNTGMMFSYDENNPMGYMAEAQHLSYLRGFDNILYDKIGKPSKVCLVTDQKREDGYLKPNYDTTDLVVLRDYTALLPYLEDGSGKKIQEHNQSVQQGDYDLHLTVDAALQKDIQESLVEYMGKIHGKNKYYHLMRVSVVVLDAQNGDLLASANYPIPDFDRLKAEEGSRYYSDNNRGTDWWAYTDRDLGTTFQSAPGSSAKVMSATAGFRKLGERAVRKKFYIAFRNIIEDRAIKEPYSHHQTDSITMKTAIVESSNCYFINLVNNYDLYDDLEAVYKTIGIGLGGVVPYYYRTKSDMEWEERFHNIVSTNRVSALEKFTEFKNNRNRDFIRMDAGEWKWAWGQGYAGFELKASPLNMARLASAIVNHGVMPQTQYVISSDSELRQEESFALMNEGESEILKGLMKQETVNHRTRRAKVPGLPSNMGGKTGTAERTVFLPGHRKGIDINDGWYMFFIEGDEAHDALAVAVRMERGVGSSPAVRLSGNMLLDVLRKHHYIQ